MSNDPLWTAVTIAMINQLTPDITGKAFDPGWFALRQRLEEAGRAVESNAALVAASETALELIGDWPTPGGALSDSWIQMPLITVQKITDTLNSAIATAKNAT